MVVALLGCMRGVATFGYTFDLVEMRLLCSSIDKFCTSAVVPHFAVPSFSQHT